MTSLGEDDDIEVALADRQPCALPRRDEGNRMPINDSWIAATAIANEMAVATQDGDYDDIPGLRVIRL